MEKISMSANVYQQMIASLETVYPEEGCGILAGKDYYIVSVLPVENELHTHDRFRMKAEGQLKVFLELDRRKIEMIGIYHSHPHGPAAPSETDVKENYYPEAAYLICSKQKDGWLTQAYRFENSKFSPIDFIVDPT